MSFELYKITFVGAVAQLVEHLVCNQGVRGSNPLSSTKTTLHTLIESDLESATWRFFVAQRLERTTSCDFARNRCKSLQLVDRIDM